MNQRPLPCLPKSDRKHEPGSTVSPVANGYFSCCESSQSSGVEELPLGRELVELCTEIAGALLRGYSDGKSGKEVRRVIVDGLISRIGSSLTQAQALVDLSLELIHIEAYGKLRGTAVDFSYLVARSRGGFEDLSAN